ncbi:DNA internalization-related competence protein ComEC/Rec2 [Pseudoduganella danionis]|uniref:DNA internalization-related competence protein ComEC/Rec2 n=1 Tax=Pseudoduganella danionis TaxID=1890295 RepID=A0ABW9SL57_9BURK|nr:DNA internalization-related competence protein ComEC/Rec2 [Pseudoduganella danionis]MTW32782.1 DNA internalization-related competence protein ComEC/Rec2 [Pseudoduganella danionis]
MRLFSISFVGGVLLLQQQASLPTWPYVLAAAACICGLAPLDRLGVQRRYGQWGRRPVGLLRHLPPVCCGAIGGFLWAALLAYLALAENLHRQDEGRDLRVTGIIDSLPSRSTQGLRFNFRVERVLSPTAGAIPARLALGWYSGYHQPQQGTAALPALHAGQRWELTVRLQRPHGNANPYGYDYEVWLLEQGLRATGYVRDTGKARLLDAYAACATCLIEVARGGLRSRIEAELAGRRYSPVIVALVVGDQHGIRAPDWQVFTRTGISHLISISGLHVTMVAGLAAMCAAWLWRRSFFTAAQLPLVLPAQKVAALAGALVAWSYVMLAGSGVPAQRTLYMLLVVALALWSGRIARFSHVLCSALLLVVLLDPWAVLWPGFWLSFGAVAVLLYAGSGRLRGSSHGQQPDPGSGRQPVSRPLLARCHGVLAEAAHAQYAVTMGLLPLTLLLFAQISLVSPVANALAIPLVSLIITPLALLGSVAPQPLCSLLLWLAHVLFAMLAQLLTWLAAQPLAVWQAPAASLGLFCWALLGTLWLLAPRGWPLRWLGLASWIPLLLAQARAPCPGAMQVTAFDVGQGMAVLVETHNHRLLYDTGPAYGREANAGSRIILPYLQARGIAMLDGLIVSHSDSDHAGGAQAILAAMPSVPLWSSLPSGHALLRMAGQSMACRAGQQWDWDGVHFEMLHPPAAELAAQGIRPNARACSMKISSAAGSLLLVADIEAAQEHALVQRYGSQLRASVLLAPHHGSKTSSTLEFLETVQPEHALFQLGYRNRYHHPHPAVWARYGAQQIKRWRTDESGAIELSFDTTVQISAYRERHVRYWYGR